MSLYRDQAIVLRTQKLGEADRIITLFTKEHGRIKAVAKGVRRTKSRFGARLEPASYVDLQLYTGRTFDTITQVVSIENYGDVLSSDYQSWTVASAILEAAERFTQAEHEPALQQFILVSGSLKALSEKRYDEALNALNMALEFNPDLKYVYYNMGLAYERKELFDLAIENYSKAIEIDPKYSLAFKALANVHNSVASLNTTSEIVSPAHNLIQGISGPCQITQLLEIGLQGELS